MTQGRNVRISVPVHGNQDLKLGLQKAIMKLAGIRDDEL
jgi:predicted RNA binding protein YcfA (HicA-like mRNA interferase family)